MFLTIINDIPEVDINNIGSEMGKFNDFLKSLINSITAKLPTIIFAVVILFIGLFFSKLTLKLIKRSIKKRSQTSKIDMTVSTFIYSLVRIVLYVIVITIVLSMLGVPTTSVIAIIGTAGVAVGLALKDSLSNVAGGFILLFTKPFKTGDYIETNNVAGSVKSINILYTELLTFDNKAVYIPNGSVSNQTLVNYSKCETRRLDLSFSVPFDTEIKEAQRIISEVLSNHSLVLKNPEPVAKMLEQTDYSIIITARVWVKNNDYWTVFFDLTEEVKTALKNAGINEPLRKLIIKN